MEQDQHDVQPQDADTHTSAVTTATAAASSLNTPADSRETLSPTSAATQAEPTAATTNDNSSSYSSVAPSAILSSWSTSSDRQLSHGSQHDHNDRVFPVRSVVSVDPGRTSGEYDAVSQWEGTATGSTPSVVPRPSTTRLNTAVPIGRSGRSASGRSDSITSPTRSAPEGGRARLPRLHAASGSKSSVQADADRRGTASHVPSFLDHLPDRYNDSDEDEGRSGKSEEGDRTGTAGRQTPSVSELPESHYTLRFKHVVTDEGHAVITGRDGTLQRCEDEPIHTPGAIQAFGMLLALREEPDGSLQVRYVSENSKRLVGYTPQELFRVPNFLDLLTDEQAENLLDHIDFIRDEDADPSVNGPEVFSLSIRAPKKKSVKLWCAIHINPVHRDLIICEFELDDDTDYPLRPSDEMTPDIPEDTLRANPTLEELTESTEILSKPLRVLRSARKRRGEAGAMQVFDMMGQVQEQLASAPNLEKFLKILVGIVKELTGFHRVMIYQFDSSFNGKVVTELVDPVQTRDLYKGLHFPATDIPKQARELYKVNKVRLLYDRDLETARMVCRSVEDLEVPLDMTHSYLRAMSPIHLKYLAHMAVRSSMSISINAFNELWGLIACHSYGNQGMRVSFPVRKMCRLVGDTASRNIERLSYASRLQARKLINTAPTDKNPSGYIIASSDDLLKLFDADFGMLSIRGETKILGKIEQTQEALAMLEYLRLRRFTSVVSTQDVRFDFPDLRYPPGFSVIAGLLYVPLSVGGNDFIVFFRRGQVREVKWAGNPYEKIIQQGTAGYLEPRKSFAVWHETVIGKCREWTEEQIETSAVLCLVYGKFIEVWRQKEAALQNSRLTRLLLANSAHEVRTPLNAIINYLEIALEGSLDQETRDNLARSHSASKSLIYVINDLLDLTATEEGNDLIKDEIFDLLACIREATEPFENDARRKGIAYDVIEYPGLPQYVYGDQRRVRQAVTNITANAVQHTSAGWVRIELYVAEVQDGRVLVEMAVEDTGKGMSDSKVDALFRDLEQVTTELDPDTANSEQEQDKPPNAKTLGLGLAVVARIVRNMDGQLRVKSEEGKGSRFVIQLPFELRPDDDTELGDGSTKKSVTASSVASVSTSTPQSTDGEVMLVNGGSTASANGGGGAPAKRNSFDDTGSIKSQQSAMSRVSARSTASSADRLIDALQSPMPMNPEGLALHRTTSSRSVGHGRTSSSPFTHHGSGIVEKPSGPPSSHLSRPAEGLVDGSASRGVGEAYVSDMRTPIKPIKVPDTEDYSDITTTYINRDGPNVSADLPEHEPRKSLEQAPGTPAADKHIELNLLIAEDDPINMTILRKRLERTGHKVFHAVNGEECAAQYGEKSDAFDVILMDMQVSFVLSPKP
jgi:light-regulated signal transduction histidine kinase (bacteriophytochrome)